MKTSLILFTALMSATTLFAEPVRSSHVEAELIAENTAFQPGQPFWVAVRLTMDEHWHTYWRNPGDSGLGTTVDWDLPEGFQAGPLLWPYPQRIPDGPLMSYAFENSVLLLTEITPPASWSKASATLTARAAWLMCKDMCIPGDALLKLELATTNGLPATDGQWAMPFASARAALPVEGLDWSVKVDLDPVFLTFHLTPRGPGKTFAPNDLYFFPYREDLIEHVATQELSRTGNDWVLKIRRSALPPENLDRIRGTLVGPSGWIDGTSVRALQVDVAIPLPSASSSSPAAAAPAAALLTGLLAMFVGGMLLNLIPCVFPVLSLKIVNLVEQSRETHESAIKHAAAFTGGVLLSMWVLAAVLLALRGSGSTVGWAFQMSSPTFVLGLTFLFLLIGLNMFGVFEMGLSLTSAGGTLQAKKGVFGSFASGLLTTVAGAPCAGPFLGTAIGFAVAQPAAIALLAFTAMGLGTALPYALLSTNPRLLKALPKPGAWMETMKQFMAFPMLVTAGWFASIYMKLHGGDDIAFRLFTAFVLVGAAAWVFGKWSALHRANGVRWAGRIVAVILLVLGTRYALQKSDLRLEPWSVERVAELRQTGQPVLVDFTAEWCAICQVNKRVALENDEVLALLKEKGVTVLLADWTDQNAKVGAGLAEFGRAAVPLYLLYGRDPAQPPEVLPQTLTPGIVLDALKKL